MRQLTNKEIANFTRQVAMILHAGISPYEGISIMNEDNHTSPLHVHLARIRNELDQGASFYKALMSTEAFPDYMLEMVHIGEESGTLENVMDALSKHYTRLHTSSEDLRSAIAYPLIMIVMMMAVVIILITQVLPIFNRVYMQLGSTLSGSASFILHLGLFLNNYIFVFVILLVLLVLLYFYLTKTAKGQQKLSHYLSKASFSKNISRKLALSHFTSGMAIALSSGLDIDDSFKLSSSLVENDLLLKQIKDAQKIMEEKDIAQGLTEAKVLTGMDARMIKLGYKTGGMEEIFHKISATYEEEANHAIDHLISIIEPTLVAILAVIIGVILLSVMLPLLGIMGSL